jgi:serine/threonine-protein kinase
MPTTLGRYALRDAIAAGGMATVHLGRLLGPAGFARTVAIKRLHPQFLNDPEFVSMFHDEARVAGRIRHPNVVSTLDVVTTDHELFLVMDYVHGESLSRLLRATRAAGDRVPLPIVSAIMSGILHGLHAAHEATTELGEPLEIVHRDVSPQNVLVGTDGIPRVLDFGVAKASGRVQETRNGNIKGKIAYMAPEQLAGVDATRLADIYSAGVIFWELLACERLFVAANEAAVVTMVLCNRIRPPSEAVGDGTPSAPDSMLGRLDAIALRALDADPALRFPTAREMALEIERCMPPAIPSEVGAWVESVAGATLEERTALVRAVERTSMPPTTTTPLTSFTPAAPFELVPPARADVEVDVQTLTQTVVTAPGVSSWKSRRRLLVVAAVGLLFGLGSAIVALRDGGSAGPSTALATPAASTTTTATDPSDGVTALRAEPNALVAPSAPTPSGAAPRAPASPTPNRAASPANSATPFSPNDCWRFDARGIKRLNTRDPRCME